MKILSRTSILKNFLGAHKTSILLLSPDRQSLCHQFGLRTIRACYSTVSCSGGASSEMLVRLKGGTFFCAHYYCIFGRFGKMIPISKSEILVRLEPHGPHC